jgi:hypothetical protein
MITRDIDHVYRVDGVVMPSVTEILTDNRMSDLFGIPVAVLERAKALGTEVHSVCEDFDNGKLKVETVDPAIVPYFRAYLQFLQDNKCEIKENEMFLYSKIWGYCGQLDRVILIGDKLGIVDLKSTTTMAPAGKIQTALYKKAYEEMTGNRISFRWCLQLKPDGTYKMYPHEDKTDEYVGTSAVQLFKWRRKYKVAEEEYKYARETFGQFE